MKEFLKRKLKYYENNLNTYLKNKRLEKEKWKVIREELELKERKLYEKEKIKVKYKNELNKIKSNLKKGPLWKRVGKYSLEVGKELWKEPKKQNRKL